MPGAREDGAGWTDANGNLWLFGGSGFDSTGALGPLDDLWKFNPSNSQWAWMGGSNTAVCNTSGQTNCVTAVFGTLGAQATGNFPGLRTSQAIWTASDGNIWLFGGQGYDSLGNPGILNDLWRFNPSTGLWTWMGGSATLPNPAGSPGIYGTLGASAPGNMPGSRVSATTWTDANGNLWLYGGYGVDSAGQTGYLDDLWEFTPATGLWEWVGGANAIPLLPIQTWNSPQYATAGVYGTIYTPAPQNHPGGRVGGIGWTDDNGNLWLYSGSGGDVYGLLGVLSDIWEFSTTTQEWAWMGGPAALVFLPPDGMSARVACPPPVFGTLGVHDIAHSPGCGSGTVASWPDSNHNLWLLGAGGWDASGGSNFADLWQYALPDKFDSAGLRESLNAGWAWMTGSNTASGFWSGIYGAQGIAAPGNIPGYRAGATNWTNNAGNFWLFGGVGQDANGQQSLLNDLWMYSQAPLASPPSLSPVPGSYAFPQSVTLSDSTPGATTYYLDTGRLDATYQPYDGPIALASWTDIRAVAMANGYYTSPVAEGAYDLLNPSPTFSPPAGTYTSPQTVTISDSQAGAFIYFTTDGSTPARTSALYDGPVTVSATETLQAIAVQGEPLIDEFDDSLIATATYTINLPPPDFSVSSSPASITVTAGQSGTTSISITPQNTFNSAVSFACSGLPAGASCTFSPDTVTPSGGSTSTTLTIATSAANAALRRNQRPLVPIAALACAFLWLSFGKRRHLRTIVLLAVSMSGLSLLSACGGGDSGSGGGGGSHPVTSTITVAATSGSLQHTATISLTVN